jgi:hypothetical protein
MLPAFDENEREDPARIVQSLVTQGCVELCCVGPIAERLHDEVDQELEERGDLAVVTTWHHDLAEGCEYFVLAAGARPKFLLALVGDHDRLVELLSRFAVEERHPKEPMPE